MGEEPELEGGFRHVIFYWWRLKFNTFMQTGITLVCYDKSIDKATSTVVVSLTIRYVLLHLQSSVVCSSMSKHPLCSAPCPNIHCVQLHVQTSTVFSSMSKHPLCCAPYLGIHCVLLHVPTSTVFSSMSRQNVAAGY